MEEIGFKEAMNKVSSELKTNYAYREMYKTMLVKAFYQECEKFQVDDDLPMEVLRRAGELAADKFLNSLDVM